MPNSSPRPLTTIHAWTYDVGLAASRLDDYAEAMATRAEQSWSEGADIVLFPEYAWAALLAHTPWSVPDLAVHLWNEVLPALAQRLSRTDKLTVLGTAPCYDEASGKLTNRAAIVSDGRLVGQDKLFLTPWEEAFAPGKGLQMLRFRGLTIAVIICLDIEIPELSSALRGEHVDLILVPSATETMLGSERITRCASARAVELGCAVIVSPLVGKCTSNLVDENLGKLAAYIPSQAAFRDTQRCIETQVFTEGFHKLSFKLAPDLIAHMRASTAETNPSLLPRLRMIEPITISHL